MSDLGHDWFLTDEGMNLHACRRCGARAVASDYSGVMFWDDVMLTEPVPPCDDVLLEEVLDS